MGLAGRILVKGINGLKARLVGLTQYPTLSREFDTELERQQLYIDELEADNQRLSDELGSIRFQGPTICADELLSLNVAMTELKIGGYRVHSEIIGRLINRSDAMPITAVDFTKVINDAMDGTAKLIAWDDAILGDPNPMTGKGISSESTCGYGRPDDGWGVGGCEQSLGHKGAHDDDDIPF